MLQATTDSIVLKPNRLGDQTVLSDGFRNLLSSYTQGINKQENRTGSLFAQNTKAKLVSCNETKIDYSLLCLNYIHQNPLRAGLVQRAEDWPYSSFIDYAHLRNGTLCAKEVAYRFIDADWGNFIQFSSEILPEEEVAFLY
ncbi:transposase [Spirosoma gilvum]